MLKRTRYYARNYFGFSRSEANGFLILLVFMIVIIIGLPIYSRIAFQDTYSNGVEDGYVLDSLVKILDASAEKKEDLSMPDHRTLFPFDPNVSDLNTLRRLGLEEPIAKRIIKYREAGGRFYQKDDLKKIYGLTNESFEQLSPFITLPDERPQLLNARRKEFSDNPEEKNSNEKYPNYKPLLSFNLNKADTAQLKQVYGIGDVLSVRIIKYRDLIGGFVHHNQLKEVYGLDEVVVEQLSSAGYIAEDFVPEKIDINKAGIETFAKHPYISWTLAKTIYAYRQQHGFFHKIEELQSIHSIDSAKFQQLKPYIRL